MNRLTLGGLHLLSRKSRDFAGGRGGAQHFVSFQIVMLRVHDVLLLRVHAVGMLRVHAVGMLTGFGVGIAILRYGPSHLLARVDWLIFSSGGRNII